MRIKFGIVTGLVVGYYLGARAGRQRYEQINRMLGRARRAGVTQQATHKAVDLTHSGLDHAKESVRHRMHHGDRQPSGFSPS